MHIKVIAKMIIEDISQERIVVLPNVQKFNLTLSDEGSGYKFAAHISRPSAIYTTLTYHKILVDMATREIFPTPDVWDQIVRQYTRSPTQEVKLKMDDPFIACKLSFVSPDWGYVSKQSSTEKTRTFPQGWSR